MWRTEDCRELTASSINHNTNIQLFFEIIKFWSNFFQKSVIFCWTKWNRTTDFPRFTGGTLPTELLSYGQSLSMFICTRFIIIDCFAWLRLRESNPVSVPYEGPMVFSTLFRGTLSSSTQPRYIVLKTFKEICFLHACFLQWFLYIFSQAPSHFPSPIKKKRSLPPISLGNFLCILRVSYRFP